MSDTFESVPLVTWWIRTLSFLARWAASLRNFLFLKRHYHLCCFFWTIEVQEKQDGLFHVRLRFLLSYSCRVWSFVGLPWNTIIVLPMSVWTCSVPVATRGGSYLPSFCAPRLSVAWVWVPCASSSLLDLSRVIWHTSVSVWPSVQAALQGLFPGRHCRPFFPPFFSFNDDTVAFRSGRQRAIGCCFSWSGTVVVFSLLVSDPLVSMMNCTVTTYSQPLTSPITTFTFSIAFLLRWCPTCGSVDPCLESSSSCLLFQELLDHIF